MKGKYHTDDRPLIETLTYTPMIQETGDLEPSTKTIVATSEISGTENADYSISLTLPAPEDERIVIKNVAARLLVDIDSFDTATKLYCRVYVDQQDIDHCLIDTWWDAPGGAGNLAGGVCNESVKATLFATFSDDGYHTLLFFFWLDQANNAVVSKVQAWLGVGNYGGTGWTEEEMLRIEHDGWLQISGYFGLVGTGAARYMGYSPARQDVFQEALHYYGGSVGAALETYRMDIPQPFLCQSEYSMYQAVATVPTDIWYLHSVRAVLYSER